MKRIHLITIIIALLGLISGLYAKFVIYDALMSGMVAEEMFREYQDLKMYLGTAALIIGIITLSLGIGFWKKGLKFWWLSVVLGLGSSLLGLLTATHVFS